MVYKSDTENAKTKSKKWVIAACAILVLLVVAAYFALVPAAGSEMVMPTGGVSVTSLCSSQNGFIDPGAKARLLAAAITRGTTTTDTAAYSENLAVLDFNADSGARSIILMRNPETGALAARFPDGTLKQLFTPYIKLLLGGKDLAGCFSSDLPRSLIINGTEVAAAEYSVTGSDLSGRVVSLEGGSSADTLVKSDSAAMPEIQNLPDGAQITITSQNGETVFSGSANTLSDFAAGDNAVYTVNIEAALPNGAVVYRFHINFAFQPVFTLSTTSAAQGDVVVLYGENVTEDIACELSFSFTPHFIYNGTACWAYIPISHALETGEKTIKVNSGGFETELRFTVVETAFGEQHLTMPESTANETVNSQAANDEYVATIYPLFDVFEPEVYWDGSFIQPAEGSITTEYGIFRYTNGSTTPTRHAGIDIANAEGTPIVAPAGAKVLFAGYLQLSGNTIMLEHGNGLHSLMMHMHELYVETGDTVAQGDVIASIGTTGYSTGPHLHYQLMIGNQSISPWLAFSGDSGFYDIVNPQSAEQP